MLLDLHEIDGVAEAGRLEQITGIAPQRRHLAQFLPVALEMAVVDGIEPDQRGEQPHIGFRDGVSHEVPLAGEAFLQPVQGGPEAGVRSVVGIL
ncbi:hypothetical protein D9M72_354360 [compost metagenome]